MAADVADAIEREIRISARPVTVFAFFTDPRKMVRWKGIQANLDPRPGGVYRVCINARDVVRGEYLEVVPHRRVVCTSRRGTNSPEHRAGSSFSGSIIIPPAEECAIYFHQ